MSLILIVDDESAIAETLADLLVEEGYEVMVASNGRDGLERIAERRPDVVLLDSMMPVMSGREMLRRLGEEREEREARDLPVILMSAGTGSARRIMGDVSWELAGFLRKPFELAQLLIVLERILKSGSPPAPRTNGAVG